MRRGGIRQEPSIFSVLEGEVMTKPRLSINLTALGGALLLTALFAFPAFAVDSDGDGVDDDIDLCPAVATTCTNNICSVTGAACDGSNLDCAPTTRTPTASVTRATTVRGRQTQLRSTATAMV